MSVKKRTEKFLVYLLIMAVVFGVIPGGMYVPIKVLASNYDIDNGAIDINSSGSYVITGTGLPTSNTISVADDISVTITISEVNISSSTAPPVSISTGATVRLILEGDNTLQGSEKYAGIRVPANSSLTIDGDGSLTVTTTGTGASIGGNGGTNGQGEHGEDAGEIIFNSGTVTAQRIGGGSGGSGIDYYGVFGEKGTAGKNVNDNTSGYGGNGGIGGAGAYGGDGGNGGNAGSVTVAGSAVVKADAIAAGGAGGAGGSGGVGGVGGQGGSALTTKYGIRGGSGGGGGRGGRGGNGGKGGNAGNLLMTTGTLEASIISCSGPGGDGGQGGPGGPGGTGGHSSIGSSATFGGNGGTGGDGGRGGDSGDVPSAVSAVLLTGSIPVNVDGIAARADAGAAGRGGSGGFGGSGGTLAGSTKNGSTGAKGGTGRNGDTGSKGGNSGAVIVLPAVQINSMSSAALSDAASSLYINTAANGAAQSLRIRTIDYKGDASVYLDASAVNVSVGGGIDMSRLPLGSTSPGEDGNIGNYLQLYFMGSIGQDSTILTFSADAASSQVYGAEPRTIGTLNSQDNEVILGLGTKLLEITNDRDAVEDLTVGYSREDAQANKQTLTIKNVGTSDLTDITITLTGEKADCFMLNNWQTTSLGMGEELSITVTIAQALGAGSYGVGIAITAKCSDDSEIAPVSYQLLDQVIADTASSGAGLSLQNTTSSVDVLVEGYTAGQASQNEQLITVRNTGTSVLKELSIILAGDDADSFEMDDVYATALDVNEEITVSVRPVVGLTEGIYRAEVIAQAQDQDGNPIAQVSVPLREQAITAETRKDGYVVTVIESYADSSKDGSTTTYPVEENSGFYRVIQIPTGYTMKASTGDATLNANASTGALHIATVTQDVQIHVVFFSNDDVSEDENTYTVTVEETYIGGPQVDKVSSYTVDKNGAFYKVIFIPNGYTMEAYTDDATLNINTASGALHIAKVTQNVLIQVTFTFEDDDDEAKGPYTVIVTESYTDGSQASRSTEYTVERDKAFYKVIPIPAGYTMEAYTDDAKLNVNATSGALHIAKVTQDVDIEVIFS